MSTVHVASTEHVSAAVLSAIKALNEAAHGHAFLEDWDHALGGTHFWIEADGTPVSHACVVERTLQIGARALRTGYVEAVATESEFQRRGFGTDVMRAATEHIARAFELGALSTGEHGFYERLGWEPWRGPTFVRTEAGLVRTEEDDGGVMVLRTVRALDIDPADPIVCDWRAGDVW